MPFLSNYLPSPLFELILFAPNTNAAGFGGGFTVEQLASLVDMPLGDPDLMGQDIAGLMGGAGF